VTRTSLSRSKGQRSRSPGRFAHRRVGASGGGRENVLAVGNCCCVAVCLAAEGTSAPTEEERGGAYRGGPPPTAYLNLLRISARSLLSAGVCPSVTFVYCIQTAKDIVKLFSQSGSGSPVILIFDPKRRYPIPRGTPSAGSLNTPGVGKICDFRLKSPFISETVRDRPILLWNVNRKWRIDPCRFR